ncbi:ABC transporter ATP-binding protein [Candidatus Hydrogenedentota bacterium]
MVEVDGLTKFYGDKRAVDNLSFEVEKGEILGFLGPNGAGKTTTMRVLTCFFPASEGTARVAGFDVHTQSMDVRKRLGYLPESVPTYRDMRANEYLKFVAEIKGIPYRKINNAVESALDQVGIGGDLRIRAIKHLSKGYRQRVGLAQALLNAPEVLILDEPTVGLDPRQIVEIRELIKSLGGDRTIILCTHILPEVSATCGRILIINQGRIVAQDTPENLTNRLREDTRVDLQIEGPQGEIRTTLEKIPGITRVLQAGNPDGPIARISVECDKARDPRRELAATIVQSGWGLLEMRSRELSLEDIFIQVVTQEEEEEFEE